MNSELARSADALLALARDIEAGAEPDAVLESRATWLLHNIQVDAAQSRFGGWAASTVIDENLAAPVIPRSLFDYLHTLAGLDAQWPVGNAGLLHVYGYLLSAVQTPYGLKNERWLGGQLARVLGLPAEEFAPWAAGDSTVLERIQAAALPILNRPADAEGLWFWAEETDVAGTVLARTVVVRSEATGDAALVYGVGSAASTAEDVLPLVTMFRLGNATAEWVNAFVAEPPRLRFNAVAPQLPARSPLHQMTVLVRP